MNSHAEVRKSSWIPWLFVGMFGVIVLVNGIMATFAFGTWSGLSTRGAYEKGVAYNETLADRARQAALGWQVAVSLEGQTPGLTVVLLDKQGVALWADSVRAKLTRPTQQGHDFEVELEDRGAGRFSAPLDLALPGIWDVTLTVTEAGETMVSSRRVVWTP